MSFPRAGDPVDKEVSLNKVSVFKCGHARWRSVSARRHA